jgi:hypothetical protein
VKVGDLVRCSDRGKIFASGIDAGVGLVIQIENWRTGAHSRGARGSSPGSRGAHGRRPDDALSIHVQWSQDSLWYEVEDLEVINESR